MSTDVEIVSETVSHVGEGPHWDEKFKRLMQVDAFAGDVIELDPETKISKRIHFGSVVTLVVPYASDPLNKWLITDSKKILRVNAETKDTEILGSVEEDITDIVTRFNDGKCDAKGRLWAGTMGHEEVPKVLDQKRGSLYSLDPHKSNKIDKHVGGVSISNGMTWSSDNRVFFYVDSHARTIDAYDFDLENGAVHNRRQVVNFNTTPKFKDCGLPDGMCLDVYGRLWVACFYAGRVLNIDPNNASLLRTIELPAKNTTSCCFGGKDYSELYVTSAWAGLSEEERVKQPEAGSTFRVSGLQTQGLPPFEFQG